MFIFQNYPVTFPPSSLCRNAPCKYAINIGTWWHPGSFFHRCFTLSPLNHICNIWFPKTGHMRLICLLILCFSKYHLPHLGPFQLSLHSVTTVSNCPVSLTQTVQKSKSGSAVSRQDISDFGAGWLSWWFAEESFCLWFLSATYCSISPFFGNPAPLLGTAILPVNLLQYLHCCVLSGEQNLLLKPPQM